MDSIKIEKIQAINRYRKQQLLYKLFLYSLTALSCSLFCSSPFWYPPLCSCMKAFLSVSLPKISSLLFSSKFLFTLGNLIVMFLVGESKILSTVSSPASDVYYDEYVTRSQSRRKFSSFDDKEEKLDKSFEEKVKCAHEDGENQGGWREEKAEVEEETEELDEEGMSLPAAEELSKRADDFIARVNKQRRLEAHY
uniref:Uncharacterized protein n=1 Tax=Davidia involucrata TaxID=16924 RepID=A0A5B7C0W4_DAVIN